MSFYACYKMNKKLSIIKVFDGRYSDNKISKKSISVLNNYEIPGCKLKYCKTGVMVCMYGAPIS